MNDRRRPSRAKVDPIFAAIEAHKRAVKQWTAIDTELDKKSIAAGKKHGRRPTELIVWRDFYIGGTEIPARRDLFLSERTANRQLILAEYRDAMERYRKQCRAAAMWDRRAGVNGLRAQVRRGLAADEAAGRRLARLKPTTLAGAAALIEYVLIEADHHPLSDWGEQALKTTARALRVMVQGVDARGRIGVA
jgi:hypothetical protein